jgi:hypothetical protein
MAMAVWLRTSEPPCFSVMPMPIRMERLCVIGRSRASCSRENRRVQLFEQGRFLLQHRDRGEGHGGRAERTGLDLRMQEVAGSAGGVGAVARLHPGQGVQAGAAQLFQQGVPGRVELDHVDAMAGAVVGLQYGVCRLASSASCIISALPSASPWLARVQSCQWAPSRWTASTRAASLR